MFDNKSLKYILSDDTVIPAKVAGCNEVGITIVKANDPNFRLLCMDFTDPKSTSPTLSEENINRVLHGIQKGKLKAGDIEAYLYEDANIPLDHCVFGR